MLGIVGGMLQKAKNKSGKVFSENNCHVSQWAPLCYNLLKDTGHAYIMTNDKNLIEYLNVLARMCVYDIILIKRFNNI